MFNDWLAFFHPWTGIGVIIIEHYIAGAAAIVHVGAYSAKNDAHLLHFYHFIMISYFFFFINA